MNSGAVVKGSSDVLVGHNAVLAPFGKDVEYGGSATSVIANIFWLLISGIPLAVGCAVNGILLCCTIIGIPFELQCFKMAKPALMPFGAQIDYR